MEETALMGSEQKTIYRLSKIGLKQEQDVVAIESPLEISIKHQANGALQTDSISITMRTPGDDALLSLGFLFTEGILNDPRQVLGVSSDSDNAVTVEIAPQVSIDLKKLERHFYTSSSCGVCGKSSLEAVNTTSSFQINPDFSLKTELLWGLQKKLTSQQSLFDKTGGIHAAALFNSDAELITMFEDVGRHNALDKLLGFAFQNEDLPLSNHFILLSGRASFELIQKGAMAGIPLMAAVGAPSSLAVDLAEEKGMTLVGFLKEERCNVYSGSSRLLT